MISRRAEAESAGDPAVARMDRQTLAAGERVQQLAQHCSPA